MRLYSVVIKILMVKLLKSVKVYILLGYITLIGIASVTVWIIYDETLDLYDNQVDMNPVSERIFLANSILMNLYEAENLERSYLQTGNQEHYQAYNIFIDSISAQIESLGLIEGNPSQLMHTDSIQRLLTKKRENLKELNSIKTSASSDKLYERALSRLTQNKDSLNQLFKMYNNLNNGKDTVVTKQGQARFFEQLINVFSPPAERDPSFDEIVNNSIQVDSIFSTFNPTDSVEQIMTSIIEDVRKESTAYEQQLMMKEQENLENAQKLTLQIRQILTKLENEEILSSLKKVSYQQEHISRMTNIVIVLGAAALLIIIGFLILILKDITRSQHYRQNLEREKAYSETLLKSKEQLMLSITHDLKSPINSIAGFADLAEKETDPELQSRFLKNIKYSTNYISRLIKDLLDFARLETGKMTIEQHEVNLNKLLEEVVSAFYPLAKEKNIELNFKMEFLDGKTYLTDGARIHQVVSNLLSNGLKFTNKGFVNLSASIVKSKGKTDWVLIEVEDSGIGISNENSNLVFEEFARVLSDNNTHYEGTGLGLTITKRIVELLGGKIQFTSTLGKGTRFSVTLPMQKQVKKADQLKTATSVNTSEEKVTFNKEHVLLADDDPFLLELTAHILREANLKVFPYNVGEDALKTLNSQSFDLLITDVQMPGINGYNLLDHFRKKNPLSIPVIAMTGESNNQQHFMDAGFNAVLQKPFQPHELISAVAACLRNANNAVPESSHRNGTTFTGEYSIEGIKAFAEGEEDTLKEILTSFAQSTSENLQVLRTHLQQNNFEEIKKLAHKMLPMFRQLEANEIIGQLQMLEQTSYIGKEVLWQETCHRLLLEIKFLMEKIIKEHQLPFSGKVIS